MAQYRLRFYVGSRCGRFVKIAFNEEGQPVLAFGAVNPRDSTLFYTKARARWAVRELTRRKEFEVAEVRLVDAVSCEPEAGTVLAAGRAQRSEHGAAASVSASNTSPLTDRYVSKAHGAGGER